jgi:hypothetical protein
MALYILLPLNNDEVDYDEYDGYVIRAGSEQAARALAEGHVPQDRYSRLVRDRWLDPTRSSCELLDSEGSAGIILGSFNAG